VLIERRLQAESCRLKAFSENANSNDVRMCRCADVRITGDVIFRLD
jgi:hypothetical protein